MARAVLKEAEGKVTWLGTVVQIRYPQRHERIKSHNGTSHPPCYEHSAPLSP
jgi:hypothetical protein